MDGKNVERPGVTQFSDLQGGQHGVQAQAERLQREQEDQKRLQREATRASFLLGYLKELNVASQSFPQQVEDRIARVCDALEAQLGIKQGEAGADS